MADERPALVLRRLHVLLDHGAVETLRTKEGTPVSVNFGQVAVAYIDDLQRKGKVFGLH